MSWLYIEQPGTLQFPTGLGKQPGVYVGQNTHSTADLPQHEVSISLIGQMDQEREREIFGQTQGNLKWPEAYMTLHSDSKWREESGAKKILHSLFYFFKGPTFYSNAKSTPFIMFVKYKCSFSWPFPSSLWPLELNVCATVPLRFYT